MTNLPPGEQVTIAALHDADSEALAIATEEVKGSTALVVEVNGTSKGLPVLETDYQVGQAFDFELEIVDGAPGCAWPATWSTRASLGTSRTAGRTTGRPVPARRPPASRTGAPRWS